MIIQWVGNFIFFYKPDNLSMIFQLVQNDNPISYKLVGIDPVDPFLCNVLFRPNFHLHNVLSWPKCLWHVILYHLPLHSTSYHHFHPLLLFIAHTTLILFPSPVHLCLYWLLNRCHLHFVLDSLFQKLVVYCVCMSPS